MDKLIVIEGSCDGIGKTTQFNLLRERLLKEKEIISHHFPSYNTPQGALVEQYLAGNFGNIKELSAYFINSLYAIDRAVTWQLELKKAYEADKTILLDRYTTSSLVYQSSFIDDIKEKKAFIDYVIDFEFNKLGIKEPDRVIYLTAPFEVAKRMRYARKDNEGIQNDIHERDIEFMKRVYDNSEFISDYLNWDRVECCLNGEMKSIDEIHENVYKLVRK